MNYLSITMANRTYRQYCFLAQAPDLVGERWTLLVVRELLLGPRRFKDLLQGLPGIGTNLLSARLKELEASGIVRRATLPPPAGSSVYELTDYGQGLWPAVVELTRWGSKAIDSSEDKVFRSEWVCWSSRPCSAGSGPWDQGHLRVPRRWGGLPRACR